MTVTSSPSWTVNLGTSVDVSSLADGGDAMAAVGNFEDQTGSVVVLISGQDNELWRRTLSGRPSVVVVLATTNSVKELRPLVPQNLVALESVKPGELLRVCR